MTTNNDILDVFKTNIPTYTGKIIVRIDPVLKPYISEFLKSLDKDIARIVEYLNEKNFGEIRSIAHRLKGEGGTYGLDEAGKLGAKIQSAAVNENAAEIDRLVKQLSDYLKLIEIIDGN